MIPNPPEAGPEPEETSPDDLSGLDAAALMAQGLFRPEVDAPGSDDGRPQAPPGIQLLKRLGRGGMGEVFLAQQVNLDRVVAVKFLAPEVARDPLFLSRLEREARTMARLRHPNIVAVHQFEWLPDGGAAIIMEWVEGGNLRDLLERHPRGVPVAEVRRLFRQIGQAIAVAHEAGVIHRDLKPENILLDRAGTPLVTDFGLALNLDQGHTHLTRSGTTVGTLDYISPEQVRGRPADARGDVYSLGVILYELLTGDLPRGHFDPPQVARPGVPRELSLTAMRALRNSAAERFQSVSEMLVAVDPKRGRSWRAPAAVLGGIAVFGIAAWQVWPKSPPPDAKIAEVETKPTIESPLSAPPPSPQPAAVEMAFAPTPIENPPPGPVEPSVSPAVATPAPVEMPRTVAVEPSATGLPANSAWRNALAGLDLNRATVAGGWRRDGSGVVSDASVCILALNAPLMTSYDVRLTFVRMEGIHSVALFFNANRSVGTAELDAWQGGLAGVQTIDWRDLRQIENFTFPLTNGQHYEMVLRVRPGQVTLAVDGQDRMTYRLGNQPLGVVPPWSWTPDGGAVSLGLGSFQSPTRFERVEYRAAQPSDP